MVVRERAGIHEYLIIASSNRDAWVLPKGHIEPGERPEDAARREVREEAGVDASPTTYLGEDAFARGGKETRIAYFLMRFAASARVMERRETAWLPATIAQARLTHEGSRTFVERAERILTEGSS